MASSSNTRAQPQFEDLAPSTSASTSGGSDFEVDYYNPLTTKLAFQSDKSYHVFLSFRGPDVRKTLVDHLYQALSAAGLNVFLDSEKLEKGEIIGLSLEKAIESSAIRIPIFSQGYADSAWCLKEAAAMLRTPGLIIPLFYHVDPTHVRYPENESSPYQESFLKHHGRSDRYPRGEIDGWKRVLQQICPFLKFDDHSVRYQPEETDGWKNALKEICTRSGWSTDIFQGSEARLVKAVVNDLIMTLHRVPLQVTRFPVGLDSMKNALIQKLNINSVDDVIKVGIWGIGGIGKTTVAKTLYNQIYADFEAASFLFNISTVALEATGLKKLQKKVLKDISKYDGQVDHVDKGISLLRDFLGKKRVLLILDDVDSVKQLNALVGDWLAPGSRVIITSRDKHILHLAGVSSKRIHRLSGLDIFGSIELFNWHAFLKAYPSPGYEDLSKKIVEACKGHPLSLEVIGSLLYDKQDDQDCWRIVLNNITLHPSIHERLKISYNALSDEEKEMFLDIACFFVGEDKRFPIAFWKSMYKRVHTAVSNLSMKMLIQIDYNGAFVMHDLVRDMGRAIAEKEGRNRLWEAAHLSKIHNTINVSRLRLNGGNPHGFQMLCRPGLRYLDLHDLFVEVMIEDMLAMLPPSLIWLGLEDCSFSTKEPRHYSLVGNFPELRILQLKFCQGIQRFSISLFSPQYLELRGCGNLNSLSDTIGNLSELEYLDLGGCENLNSLSHIIGSLSRLNYLNLSGCGSLNNLPTTIGNLWQLQHLDLKGCKNLNSLPDTLGNLSQLQHLDLEGCRSLNNLPDSIGNLLQLQHLDMKGCQSLNNLPDSIGNLSQLQQLDLRWCESLSSLPSSIGNLSQLQHLALEGCSTLNNLPDTLGNLSQLQHLDLEGCANLNNLPYNLGKLSQLQQLNLEVRTNLNTLPNSIGNLSQLKYLSLKACKSLNKLPDTIGNLSQLKYLSLEACKSLNKLPDTIGNLSQLQQLDLTWCENLSSLPASFGNLLQLKYLDLRSCESLSSLPDSIGNLSQLQHLNLQACRSLSSLPDSIGNLSQLQKLDLTWCENLSSLPGSISNLSQLQKLDLEGSATLNKPSHNFDNILQLKILKLKGRESF